MWQFFLLILHAEGYEHALGWKCLVTNPLVTLIHLIHYVHENNQNSVSAEHMIKCLLKSAANKAYFVAWK